MAPSPSKERKTVYDIRRLVYTTWQRNRIENSKLNEIDGISSAKRAFHRLCSSNRERRGRGNCQNTPDYRDQRRSVFLASVSLSGVYINIFQICQVLPISLPRSSDEQKQQKEYSYICRLRDVFVTNRKEAIAGARWEIKERPIVTSISMERRASISRSEVNNRCFSHLRRHSLHNRRATLLLSQSSHRSFFGGQV